MILSQIPLRVINSTIGRFFISTTARVRPAAMERYAADAFARPLRRSNARPMQVAGLAAHRFLVEDGGYRLAAWDWGDAGGPTVLLVHGWNGGAHQMTGFVRPLVELGCYVVAFDLPAHGASTGARANLLDLARAVGAVARRVGPVHGVIAHSLGATATAVALSRGLAVERAVLLAPPAEVQHFAAAFATGIGIPAQRVGGVIEQVRRELGGDLGRFDPRHFGATMQTPLLVMHDPRDREVPFAHGMAFAQAWPGARLHPLANLGHRRVLTDAAAIAEAVSFVGSEAAPSRPQRDALALAS